MNTTSQDIRQTGTTETTAVSSVTIIPSSITGSESPGPSSSGSVLKRKRTAGIYSEATTIQIDECFSISSFPSNKNGEKIAKELDLTMQEIEVWFQNQRGKHRRTGKRHQLIKATASAIKAPIPPALWPTNLSFDSDISKVCSTVSEAKTGRSSASSDNNGGGSNDTSVASCPMQLTSSLHLMSSEQSGYNIVPSKVSTSLKSDKLPSPVATTSFQASLLDYPYNMMLEHDAPDLTHSFVDESMISQVPPTQQHWLHHSHHYVDQVPNEGCFQDHKPPHSNLYPSPHIETVPTGHAQPGQHPFFHSTGYNPAHHCPPQLHYPCFTIHHHPPSFTIHHHPPSFTIHHHP